jgi:hypothetical protein
MAQPTPPASPLRGESFRGRGRFCYRAPVKTEITEAEYRELERLIASDASPVGIDAKKTHVLILHKLTQIEARLARLEASQRP